MFEAFLIGLAANAGYGITAAGMKAAYRWLETNRPDLVQRLHSAESAQDGASFSKTSSEARDAIVGAAADGRLEISGAMMKALKEIEFDHENGYVRLRNVKLDAQTIVTGGSIGSTGETLIDGDTSLKTDGTEIRIQGDASIKITGGGSIKQS